MATTAFEVTSLPQLEVLVKEIGGPHRSQINVIVSSCTFGDAVAMAAILRHMTEAYQWRVANFTRLRALADLYVIVNRIAEVNLPRIRSDVRDAQAVALLRGRGATIIELAGEIGGPSVDIFAAFVLRLNRLADHIGDRLRSVRARQGLLDDFASVILNLLFANILLPFP
ncbi:Os03g0202400 [Oryza sativa Japonica Group]|jgi:hypothetical protein|uniref:Os03g0202400 protein n=2 Tax=Oryza sativa subsp. japonica TaxID=39947 RepID=Q10QB4_ORYSJ|nr:hypothetical protein LOC_Os03g10530 [Oryza sativa Japonica Group]BAS82835.1 Os03g0202400 [Oryza sativa Japonica Group]